MYQPFEGLNTVKLFYGIPVPESVYSYLKMISGIYPGLKWVKQENLHLTLLFIGNVSPELAESILRLEYNPVDQFTIEVEKPEIINKRKGGLIWLRCTSPPTLKVLNRQLTDKVCPLIPIKDKDRPFTPHITLARSNSKIHMELPPAPNLSFTSKRFVLYQSVSEKETGLKYKILKEYNV